MPLMPQRPSKKAQMIAESLNPLLRSAKIPLKRKEYTKNRELMRRDAQVNFRYPEANP